MTSIQITNKSKFHHNIFAKHRTE